MKDFFTILFKALPANYDGWARLITEITFLLWLAMESAQILIEKYSHLLGGLS